MGNGDEPTFKWEASARHESSGFEKGALYALFFTMVNQKVVHCERDDRNTSKF